MAADTETAPAPPPNLRKSNPDDKAGECETCVYFDHTHCTAFPPLCVDAEWLCNHYRKSGKPDSDSSSQPKTMSEASSEALKRLRAVKQGDKVGA